MDFVLPKGGVIQWRDTPGFKFIGDADELVAHVESLAESKGGSITTDELVADAMDQSSPLYPNIEQDERVAAHNWRKHQMRNLVGALVRVTVIQDDEEDKPREIRVKAFPHTSQGYTPVHYVFSDADLRQQYLGQLANEMRSWARKAQDFKEFATVVSAINGLPERANDNG